MNKVRELIKNSSNNTLMDMYRELSSKDMDNSEIAVNAVLETELEARGLIVFNEDTFEYEIVA